MIELPQSLVGAIESTHVAFEGLSHPLRLVSAEHEPGPPMTPTAARLTVQTQHNGTKRATCVLSLDNLADAAYVTANLAETMRLVLAGELEAGERRLL